MAEYIEREAALEAIRNLYPGIPFTKRLMQKWHEENRNFMQCESAIERLPAADVVPVRHGRWIDCKPFNPEFNGYECSECGAKYQGFSPDNYCPNCGARMDA
jgi:rubrerythrin